MGILRAIVLACLAAWAAGAAPEAYSVRDFRSACEYLLEQAIVCTKQIHLHIPPGVLSEAEREQLLYLLPNCRLAELRVVKTEHQYCLEPAYKSCVRMLNYARGNTSAVHKLSPLEEKALREAQRVLHELRVEQMPPAEIARAVHDWLVLHCEYDTAHANMRYKNSNGGFNAFDGKYLLLHHKGVCDAYVQAYWLLLQLAGVPCSMISGHMKDSRLGHAWNLVLLGDHWAHVDTTFDDPVPDRKGEVQHRFFDKTDAEMSQDRTWNRVIFPGVEKGAMPVVRSFASVQAFLAHLRSLEGRGSCSFSAVVEPLRGRADAAQLLREAALQAGVPGAFSVGQDPLYPYALRVHYRADVPLTALAHSQAAAAARE